MQFSCTLISKTGVWQPPPKNKQKTIHWYACSTSIAQDFKCAGMTSCSLTNCSVFSYTFPFFLSAADFSDSLTPTLPCVQFKSCLEASMFYPQGKTAPIPMPSTDLRTVTKISRASTVSTKRKSLDQLYVSMKRYACPHVSNVYLKKNKLNWLLSSSKRWCTKSNDLSTNKQQKKNW